MAEAPKLLEILRERSLLPNSAKHAHLSPFYQVRRPYKRMDDALPGKVAIDIWLQIEHRQVIEIHQILSQLVGMMLEFKVKPSSRDKVLAALVELVQETAKEIEISESIQ